MAQDKNEIPFSRVVRLDRVPAARLNARIEAGANERAAIALLLDLQGLDALSFDYTLAALPQGRFKLTGRVEGTAKRLCVVTLEPLEETASEEVAIEFWPAEQLQQTKPSVDREIEVSLDGPEPLTGGSIDLGQFAFETFAAALDPYPRKAGADFQWKEPEAEGEAEGKPFAVLRQLKG